MTIRKYAAPAAILTALTLTTSLIAQAGPKNDVRLATMPNLVVEVATHASDQSLVIRNAGGVASAFCHVRMTFSTGETYLLPIMELQPGAVENLWPPLASGGKQYTIRIEADCYHEVAEASEDDNELAVRILR